MLNLKWKAAQYFESRWWRWYLRKKDPLAYHQWKLNYWHNFLNTIAGRVSLQSSGHYLDLGCGPAGIFMLLPGNIAAVDPLIDKYKKDFPFCFQHLDGKVTFHAVKAEDFESKLSFDAVFCINVINHVDDIENVMRKLRDLCKTGGTLVISVDEHRWQLLHRIFRWLPLDILHPHQLSRKEFEKMLISSGFTVNFDTILKTERIFRYRLWVAQ